MSGKSRTVYWQVLASVDGKQWPLLIATELPATPTKLKEAAENVAGWLLSCNMYPGLGRIPLAEAPPEKEKPMPQKDAIRPPLVPPMCPHCQKAMLQSKHQDAEGALSYYCGQRTDNNNYCLWRGSISLEDQAQKVWEIKP